MKVSKELMSKAEKIVEEFIKFNRTAVSPYHAVHNVEAVLKDHKFTKLEEEGEWKLEAGGNYYLTRGTNSSLVAFSVPKNVSVEQTSFKMIGTHTDSPCLRLAPKFERSGVSVSQTYVQTYGGGLWHTWLDRDLVLGGRVSVRKGNSTETRLFLSDKAVAKIPNLAIHLTKDPKKLEVDKEGQLRPVLASELFEEEDGKCSLRAAVAEQLGEKAEDILDFDLCFGDAQEISRFGLHGEFLSSPRLDNLASVFNSLKALLSHQASGSDLHQDISLIAMFDHEEIGSQTYVGADSAFLKTVLRRITDNLKLSHTDGFSRIISRSFFLSCDMAHAVHPNFQGSHQAAHQPKINQGIVLKINANGRYTTDGITGAIVRRVSEAANVPITDFIVANDSPCGSTIGPIVASKLGCMSADIGAPMWSMHSIRETAGVVDFHYTVELMQKFFEIPMKELIPKFRE